LDKILHEIARIAGKGPYMSIISKGSKLSAARRNEQRSEVTMTKYSMRRASRAIQETQIISMI
jgi:hypothetical protein